MNKSAKDSNIIYIIIGLVVCLLIFAGGVLAACSIVSDHKNKKVNEEPGNVEKYTSESVEESYEFETERSVSEEANETDEDEKVVYETDKYQLIIHGDEEYCTVNKKDSGEELCTITQGEGIYPVDFNEGILYEHENVFGYEGFAFSFPYGDYNRVGFYWIKDGEVKYLPDRIILGYSFEDADNDGITELVINHVFLADGGIEVFAFRSENDTIQKARIHWDDPNQFGSFYDSDSKMINVYFRTSNGDDFESISVPVDEVLLDPDHFEYEDYDYNE